MVSSQKLAVRVKFIFLKSLLGTIPKSTLEKQLVEISTIVPEVWFLRRT